MARFDEELIRRLKAETDIVGLIESYGTKLKDRGNGELIGLCPVHDDKSPSLVVNRQKNVWNCLGACGCGGDVIQWVMHAEKVSFRHAVELLRDGATGSSGGKKFTTERKLDCPLSISGENSELLQSVVSYYHERLKESPTAIEYLQGRGITSSEAMERFKIGFVDRTLGLRLPAGQIKAGAEIRQQLKEIGIVRDSGHEHLRGCVVFPLTDANGRVVQIYGRRIDNGQCRTSKHFYLPGPHHGLFNREALAATDEIILCESIIDALTFWCAGYRNVTTIYGTNGLTDELLDAFKSHQTRRLLLAFDADEAGNAAVEKHRAAFESLGLELFRIHFPAGQDANSYALKLQPASRALELVIRKAEWIGKGMCPGQSIKFSSASNDVSRTGLAAGSSEAPTIPANESTPEPQPQCKTPAASALPLSDEATINDGDRRATLEKQPPAVSPVPPAPTETEAELTDNEIRFTFGNRTYRVRGFERATTSREVLKVNVLVRREELFHVDTFDLYASRARLAFIKEVSAELHFDEQVIKRDLGKILLKLEALQDQQLEETAKEQPLELSDKDKQAALELLKQPNLIERILTDFEACGVVGEETNKLVGYLAATSRKLDKPLAVVIQSSSAAGKSSLMEAVLKFIPAEEQVGYSAMTGQSLFYMGGMELKHKILAIAEEEGVAQASYALKLLQSEGQLTIASTGKDPGTGRMETQEYHVEGPVMIFLTTTAIDIDEELLNRCVVLSVDENRQQTRAIQNQQRINETLDGMLASKRTAAVRKLHQNAQRLLRPLLVVNPFAGELRFIDDCARRRRDHMKYLALIRSIALLHQYQRPLKTVTIDDETVQYIEVAQSDIALANRLCNHVLGNSIDELPPQTRRLLLELFDWLQSECKRTGVEQSELAFSRRQVREALGWHQTQLCIHFQRLTEMDYLLVRRGGRGNTLVYELLYDGRGREGQPTLCGLIDVQKLPSQPDASASGQSQPDASASGRSNPIATNDSLSGSIENLSEIGGRLSPSNRPENGSESEPERNGKAK